MDLETLLLHPPLLHASRIGAPVSWRASDRLLRYLDTTLKKGDVTLETGAGVSTLVFAMKRCNHTVVVPDQAQVDRIVGWCEANRVSPDCLTFQVSPSEVILPSLVPEPLDLVLIDGAHGFPMPLLDWFYAGRRVRTGGVLVVDDVRMWSVRILYEFLSKEPQWRIESKTTFDFFVARRVGEGPLGEWLEQPYLMQRTYDKRSPSAVHRLAGRVAIGSQLFRGALRLAQKGEWAELRHRISSYKQTSGW
jgi:hypothetical protein